MSEGSIRFLGVGDIHLEREDGASIFQHVQSYFDRADLRYVNAEQVYSGLGAPTRDGATDNYVNGAQVYKEVGVDAVSYANNHSLDWGPEALLDTLEKLEAEGIRTFGAGANLGEARKPAIIEKNGVSVGFLAYCSVGPVHYQATENSTGYAPAHAITTYEQVDSQPGTPPKIHTYADAEQMLAVTEDIRALKAQCDVVVVAFHWGVHFVPYVIPDYCYSLGYAAADAGADLILGTHAHVIKGFEIYNGTPIFYGTGNFALEMQVEGNTLGLAKVLGELTKHYGFELNPDYPNFPMHPQSRYTFMVDADIDKSGVTECRIIPCLINRQAEPVPVRRGTPDGDETFEYIQQCLRAENLPVTAEWASDEHLVVVSTA